MKSEAYRIFPLGVDALTVDFGNEISIDLNEKAVNLAAYFEENPFAGLREIVPAYASTTIFFDVFQVRKTFSEFSTAFEAVKNLAENAVRKLGESLEGDVRQIGIPVDFGREFALDLEDVARLNNLTRQTVIDLFTARTYRVFMLGFMPGFAYMGKVDRQIAAPRKKTPRALVPKGSVGIAGRQTGIYSFDSPGGWQIIGRTGFRLFTPEAEHPCALKAGDLIRFYAVNE